MAKKNALEPGADTHRFIRLDLEHTVEGDANASGYWEDFHYIDLSRELSAINSRLYRQGMMYHVANITVHDLQANAWLKFCTVPHTWPAKMAWRKGFLKWFQMNDELPSDILESAMSAGKWLDYRVYFNDDHRTDPDCPRFTDIEGNLIIQDEHKYTEYFSTDGGAVDAFTAHMMGEHNGLAGSYTSVGLIEAYEETLTQKYEYEEPDMSTGVWANLFERAGEADDIADAISDDYDNPPYSLNLFPGSKDGATKNSPEPWCIRECHQNTGTSPMTAVGGFPVPLGLICVETSSRDENNNTIGLMIELVPGEYQGVKAERMGKPIQENDKSWRIGN